MDLTESQNLDDDLECQEVGRVKQFWKGIYGDVDQSANFSYNVILLKQVDEDKNETFSPYLIPTSWLDSTRGYYLYPPPKYKSGMLSPQSWTNLVFVRHETPKGNWVEHDVHSIETDKPVSHLAGRRIIKNIKSGIGKEDWTDPEVRPGRGVKRRKISPKMPQQNKTLKASNGSASAALKKSLASVRHAKIRVPANEEPKDLEPNQLELSKEVHIEQQREDPKRTELERSKSDSGDNTNGRTDKESERIEVERKERERSALDNKERERTDQERKQLESAVEEPMESEVTELERNERDSECDFNGYEPVEVRKEQERAKISNKERERTELERKERERTDQLNKELDRAEIERNERDSGGSNVGDQAGLLKERERVEVERKQRELAESERKESERTEQESSKRDSAQPVMASNGPQPPTANQVPVNNGEQILTTNDDADYTAELLPSSRLGNRFGGLNSPSLLYSRSSRNTRPDSGFGRSLGDDNEIYFSRPPTSNSVDCNQCDCGLRMTQLEAALTTHTEAVQTTLDKFGADLKADFNQGISKLLKELKTDAVNKNIVAYHKSVIQKHFPTLPCESVQAVIAVDTALLDINLSISMACYFQNSFKSSNSARSFIHKVYERLVNDETSQNMIWRATPQKNDPRQGTNCLLNMISMIGASLELWMLGKKMDESSRISTKDLIDHIQSGQKEARQTYCSRAKLSSEQAKSKAPPSITLAAGYNLRKEEFSIPELEGRIIDILEGTENFVMPVCNT